MKSYTMASFLLLMAFCTACKKDKDDNVRAPLTEEFDSDTTELKKRGWIIKDNSAPGGIQWGNMATSIAPFSGTQFIATKIPALTQKVSCWLITPLLNISNGDTLTFYTTAVTTSAQLLERLQVRMNTTTTSENVGNTPAELGDFTLLLKDINAEEFKGGYPQEWTKVTILIKGLATSTRGRIAFRSYREKVNVGSNRIAIDKFTYRLSQ
jgi:hypothetical protein